MDEREYKIKRYRMLAIENIGTLFVIGAVILGVLALTGSYAGFWALLFLMNMNKF